MSVCWAHIEKAPLGHMSVSSTVCSVTITAKQLLAVREAINHRFGKLSATVYMTGNCALCHILHLVSHWLVLDLSINCACCVQPAGQVMLHVYLHACQPTLPLPDHPDIISCITYYQSTVCAFRHKLVLPVSAEGSTHGRSQQGCHRHRVKICSWKI
jgi:hypothetical protein